MGRKIPGKKHRGTKDPAQQKAVREARVAHIVNAPPEFPDDQKVPKSLLNFIQLKKYGQEKKEKKPKRKRFIRDELAEGAELRRKLYHLKNICKEKITEARYEAKFGVHLVRDKETGEFSARKCPDSADAIIGDMVKKCKEAGKKMPKRFREELEEMKKDLPKKKNTDKGKRMKRDKKEKIKAKKNRRDDAGPDFNLKDEVRFGEIVHEPPTLVRPKTKVEVKNSEGRRPGQKDLLLKSLLKGNEDSGREAKRTNLMTGSGALRKKQKVPESAARQLMIAKERQRVVEAYRQLKAQKRLQ